MSDLCLSGAVFGTMGGNNGSDETTLYDSVLHAIEVGYRQFDLAERYANQEQVGRALRDSGIPREEFTIISKVDGMLAGDYDSVKARVVGMLETVGLEYFDVLLIHYPLKSGSDLDASPSELVTTESWLYFKENILSSWEHMTQLQCDQLSRHVGVSNFYQSHLQELLPFIKRSPTEQPEEKDGAMEQEGHRVQQKQLAPIAMNEVYIDAAHPENDLVAYCQSENILCVAYRPLAFIQVYSFLENVPDLLEEACSNTGCANQQELVLRWLQTRKLPTITSSTDKEHMNNNFKASSTSGPEESKSIPVLDFIAEQAEMVDMYGGVDEYAAAFKVMN